MRNDYGSMMIPGCLTGLFAANLNAMSLFKSILVMLYFGYKIYSNNKSTY